MDEKPLESIVIHCEGCKNDTEHNFTNTRYVPYSIYKTSKEVVHLEKPVRTYSCGICKTIYEFLEKRNYDQKKEEERRKNR